jgi:hypothetical protein
VVVAVFSPGSVVLVALLVPGKARPDAGFDTTDRGPSSTFTKVVRRVQQ